MPRLKKPRKPSKSNLIKKADAAFSLAMRSLIGYCQANGKLKGTCGGVLQNCHIETRGNRTLRYDPMNVLVMCAGHHRFSHQHPLDFIEMVLHYYKDQYDYVKAYKNKITKYTLDDYQNIINYYANYPVSKG